MAYCLQECWQPWLVAQNYHNFFSTLACDLFIKNNKIEKRIDNNKIIIFDLFIFTILLFISTILFCSLLPLYKPSKTFLDILC